MNFNQHGNQAGKHAFLSASKYAWLRYDDDKLIETFKNHQNATLGSRLHEFAKSAIEMGIKLPRTSKTLNAYVNDAIGYRMTPEVVLYFSDNIFGTADSISFRKERGSDQMVLRIHDLKTGFTKASFDQLLIYTAMFCFEYREDPAKIDIVLRLYQNDEVMELIPTLEDIVEVMGTMKHFDKIIEQLKTEEPV